VLSNYRGMLRIVPGEITLHGPFMDMVSGSPDNHINEVCSQRYQHAIRIASELHARYIVFHANFIGSMHNPEYRVGWHDRNVAFWHPLAAYAKEHGIIITIENMWEFDPYIIGNLLKEVNHPNLRACLDIGHAHLFANDDVTFDDWLSTMQPWLVHTHINNNDGELDIHQALNHGVLDYATILPKLRALPTPPTITLEMYKVKEMRASLPLLELKNPIQETA
ncbi:MAG: sugar phosphate isomerase/epimerase, partial [Anaerolineae bacterium]|nr:sugar phosphate isomerase/epimerase [Anaerolineae bacterium]